MPKVTVQDIAEALNLSVGTIYRSLNNTGRVSEKTKKLVLDYANQVGFQPNAIAQGLAKRKKYHIVFLISKNFPDWWDSIYAGAEKAAQELSEFGVEVTYLRYALFDSTCRMGTSHEIDPIGLLERIERNEVDGIILVPSIAREVMASLDLAKKKGIPVICINADAPLTSQRLCYYGPDEEQVGNIAGELMGKFVGAKGKILLLGIETNDFFRLALRKKGFFNQLCRYFPEVTVLQQCSFSTERFQDYLRDTLNEYGKELSGIYVYDSIALKHTASIVKELGLSNIIIIGHECLSGCRELIQEGWIHATLCQERFSQGYYPLKLMYDYLRSNIVPESRYYSNVNIVFRSNLDLQQKNERGCGFQ